MTGNLPEFIDKLNDMQERYLRRPDKSLKKKKTEEADDEIPLADCIVTEINSDGELKGFRIRPELAKLIMYKTEEGEDLRKINKIIMTVNYLNRIIFKPDDYLLGT